MSKTTAPKKTADWHPADIVCALRKAGWSLRRLSIHHDYKSGGTLKIALSRPWPKAQNLIAQAIGVPPESIWPSRYKSTTQAQKPHLVTGKRKAA